jgi:hypothetical protein
VHGITAEAIARKARARQAWQQGQDLAEDSYGRQYRHVIAARETTIANGLRPIERAYHQALEPAPAPEFSQVLRPGRPTIECDLELE